MTEDNAMKSKGYELIRNTLYLDACPKIAFDRTHDSGSRNANLKQPLYMSGLETVTANYQDATERGASLLHESHRLIKARKFSELIKILDDYPVLGIDPWLSAELLKLDQCPRFRDGRGRRRSSFLVHPFVIVGCVLSLIAQGLVKTNIEAFAELVRRHLVVSFDVAKQA